MILGAVAITFLGVLTVLNLILTLAVVRRLREHSDHLSRLLSSPGGVPWASIIGSGERPRPFTATTVDGGELTESSLTDGTIVAFFSPTCSACHEWVPRFAEAAEAVPGRAIAVVVADSPEDGAGHVTSLRAVARVVVEEQDGAVAKAFGVTGYPAMCRMASDGTVATSDNDAVVTLPSLA
ncbi:TlpA family protein [Planobispora rosea]|uniref:TlpA family protein n=1 Tax=Planobispora rosea TaxID=35762 RepID=A0A8J3RXS8_PLARO|nr:redoxin domain-containing protein [Planobispora rosea]GGS53342.1 TlpA family protein [Planobispora rosea]GIH82600.1 TlpA family protein [Planobispora rosea]